MKKRFTLLFLASIVSLVTFGVLETSFAGVPAIPGRSEITSVSNGPISGGDSLEKIQNGGLKILHTAKVIISFLAVIYLIYVGATMVTAMGDEKAVTSGKKQLMYTLIAFLFVNIPGELYAILAKKQVSNVTSNPIGNFTDVPNAGSNIFFNLVEWNSTIENGVLSFIRVGLIGAAVFMFSLAAFEMITSGGSEEKTKQAKNRFLYGVLGLVFVAVIQSWVQVVYSGDIGRGQGIFAQLSNLALFFAGPTAIFFLLLGGYYYITSAGEEEKAKKGKNIVINTFIAVIILLASYAFLRDLADFKL
ncbi:MAG: hypothetical protein Q8K26_04485 [Candidatus Gracilibacteria bacterium]|nr:hypothetical protein [Candidatus Gracilibacteria bacterium]